MKFYRQRLATVLLAGATVTAHAQNTPSLPPLRATLDTVTVTGTTRVLTLSAAPGPDISVRSLTPGTKMAVLHTPPDGAHEYDLVGIRLLVSKQYNRSSTGLVLVNLLLPDSSTQAPSDRALLPAPIAVTDREIRRAKNGVLTLDVRAYHLTLPASGAFVVAEGAPEPPYRYLGDTVFADRGLGRAMPSQHVRLGNPATPGQQRIVNATDFICVRDVRTTVQPQTWDYSPKKGLWTRRQASYPKCPRCVISNAGLELVVREL
ncbi:hypothetical protein [Hymenobacter sp. IS2118]|uniref:hypothetical protein n=1 Tax=Hymenobacter sp. IS2118 TaxID=1505605 RepID=UPI000557F3C0|nr:hypothetical protein [Hymenobacter sp. IS2118]